MLYFSDFLYEQAITTRVKLGKCALAVEGMLETIMDTLGCSDYDLTLSIITTLNGFQGTLSKPKEDLEAK